ncbi:MAG: ATP-dependent 6-phosphofructokinase [Candidatus Glassbacteria bacterium]|nr:ATP-dependent 6-phosphofructokinase [Candidatus Glassbacteria bacterium]
MLNSKDLEVARLGPCKYESPLNLSVEPGDGLPDYVPEDARIPYQVSITTGQEKGEGLYFEKAGPRAKLFFPPRMATAAIVTCGGLSPGLNNVIQSIYLELFYRYNVKRVLGVRYGLAGFDPDNAQLPVEMTPDYVDGVQKMGGSVLGCSRGEVSPEVIADRLEEWGVDILFAIGGDGTLRASHEVAVCALERGLKLAVIGVPKTIDNDILYVYKTFGFETAVDEAARVLNCAHNEAIGAPNGIGLVKLMGRDSGFIACFATLASMVVNFTLIPEVQFDLEGERGILTMLRDRLKKRGHAVIAVAEGAGLEHCDGELAYDESGNIKYSTMSKDIGMFLRDKIKDWFDGQGEKINIKYIDPSYLIRSVPANSSDSLFCNDLGRAAVHAAMTGRTDMVVGLWHNVLTHVPLTTVTSGKKKVSPDSMLWLAVTEATGQPVRFRE